MYLNLIAYQVSLLLVGAEEVAIEVPEASRYVVTAPGLRVDDASGDGLNLAEASFSLCGEGFCAPFHDRPSPLKLSASGPIRINDRTLIGSVWVMLRSSRIVVVNRLPLEDYLVATVGSEMPRTFPLEALKAQAVAARTYALSRKIMREGEIAHMSSTTLDQVYGGLEHESDETRAAVKGTAGEVLVFERQPIDALFFSSCSGHTRDGPIVFPAAQSYLKSVPCPSCKLGSAAKWALKLSYAELSRRIGAKVTALTLDGETTDGRARDVVVSPSGQRIAPEALRKKLGYTALKSADFVIACDDRGCAFNGLGFGHGVGMCQWGARGLALDGQSYRDILAHYYPGVALKKLY